MQELKIKKKKGNQDNKRTNQPTKQQKGQEREWNTECGIRQTRMPQGLHKNVFWQIKRDDTSLERIQGGVRRESTSAVELMLHEFRDKEFRDKGEESYGADRWGLLLQPTDISTVASEALLTALLFCNPL